MALQVQAVLQAQDAEFVFGQFIRQAPTHLVPVLCDSLFDDQVIVLVIAVHLVFPVNVLMGARIKVRPIENEPTKSA
jgi:hypothetical protein